MARTRTYRLNIGDMVELVDPTADPLPDAECPVMGLIVGHTPPRGGTHAWYEVMWFREGRPHSINPDTVVEHRLQRYCDN